ncbi:MAG TPA: hypothetical protein VNU46_03965 [Gemmatimonadaceae bacterium]|jgi:DNA-directed RNA polymerase specialized sigma24 family protein|nr:hypothetical protein [Gemmatimonadaceae bacterium]
MPTPFDRLYNEYVAYITRLARRLAKADRDIAEDLMQEAWLALLLVPEDRWTEPRYLRSVIYYAMCRWLVRDARQRVIEPPELPPLPRRRQVDDSTPKVLRFRRNVPRQQLQPDTPARRRAA